ncbi:MAG: NUMOD4 domain-containing protein [Candidatus Margulisbacteria bacterium]|nr:NUMOD4 domain-containing protein [Candidatus Margulisiibacteriota bacterium]
MNYVSNLRGSVIPWDERPKYVKGYEKLYIISNRGRIFSVKSQKWLKLSITSKGYEVVSLSKLGVRKKYLVHRLVYGAYIGSCENLRVSHYKEYSYYKIGGLADRKNNAYHRLTIAIPKSLGVNKKKYFREYMREYRKKKKKESLNNK